jgi:hypothetical protein
MTVCESFQRIEAVGVHIEDEDPTVNTGSCG